MNTIIQCRAHYLCLYGIAMKAITRQEARKAKPEFGQLKATLPILEYCQNLHGHLTHISLN